jgi:hypothetical protein
METNDNEVITIASTGSTVDSVITCSVTASGVTYSSPNYNYANVTIGASNYSTLNVPGGYLVSTGSGTSWTTGTTQPGLHVTGDCDFEGDVKVKGRSLEKLLTTIEDRLAILQDPDPAKLEKYAALKKAYEHYKTLERLIGDD